MLGLYREINLLFNLSEKLASSLELQNVARMALGEATSLIQATDGAVMLFDEEQRKLTSIASVGSAAAMQSQFECKEREERLRRQIEQLKIELDEAKMAKQVAEITESDYFQRLREQADALRETLDDSGEENAQ